MAIPYEQLDWNALKAFLIAAREGSFSKAANQLGVTQPTLSRQIFNLESELNVTLFERLSTGLKLTDAGSRLLDFVAPMAPTAQNFSLAVAGLTESLEGEVSLSVSEIDALFRLPELIEFIHQQAPSIQLTIHVSNKASNLKQRDADIALRSFRPSEPDLIAKKLTDEPIWFYGTPNYLAKYGHPTQREQIQTMQIIGFERNLTLINHLNSLEWPVAESNFNLVTSFQGLQWELVKRGLALGFFPQAIGDQEPSLTKAFFPLGPVMVLPLWLVTHRELRTSPRINRVFQLISEWFIKKQS